MEELCQGCNYNFTDLVQILDNKEKTLDFLCGHNLIERKHKCSSCGRELHINDNYTFRCSRRRDIRKNRNVERKRCHFSLSARSNTLLARSNFHKAIILVYLWNFPRKSVTLCAKKAGCSVKTVMERFAYCRELVLEYCIKSSSKLGGVGKTVEVDEAELEKKTHNQGQAVEGKWVVGGVERDSSNVFLVAVEQRDKRTLHDIITNNIIPGTHIVTNSKSSFRNFNEDLYQHSTVNHSLKFLNPTTCADTENIEKEWCEVRVQISQRGKKEKRLAGHLAESIFQHKFPVFSERFHNFLLYAGKHHASLTPNKVIPGRKIKRRKRPKWVEPESSDFDEDQPESAEEDVVVKVEVADDYLYSSNLEWESLPAHPNDEDSMKIRAEDSSEGTVKEEVLEDWEYEHSACENKKETNVIRTQKAQSIHHTDEDTMGLKNECFNVVYIKQENVEDWECEGSDDKKMKESKITRGEKTCTAHPTNEDSMEVKKGCFHEVYIKEEKIEDWELENSFNGSKIKETNGTGTDKVYMANADIMKVP